MLLLRTGMQATSHPLVSPPHHLTSVSVARYLPDRHLCHLLLPRGKLLHSMAHHHSQQHLLHCEEALYLLERGLLELLHDDVPLSVQEGYALMEQQHGEDGSGGTGGALDAYVVYAELKAQGWIVLRPTALYRERRPPPPPAAPFATFSLPIDNKQVQVTSSLTTEISQPRHEAHDTPQVAVSTCEKTRVPQPAAMERSLEQAVATQWAEMEWGCTDEAEQARSRQLLQLPFLHSASSAPPVAISTSSSTAFPVSDRSPLSSLPLFALWPPSAVSSFRRSSPSRPSHLLLVSRGVEAEEARVVAALQTRVGLQSVWARAEFEIRGVQGKGESSIAVQDIPVLLATVHLTRVSYVRFDPLLESAHENE